MTGEGFSHQEIERVRAAFPALVRANSHDSGSKGYIFAENAGGSQVLASVASSISNYLLSSNVQMASYDLAKQAETRVSRGTCAAAALLGAESPDDVMVGQSATQLVASLAGMIESKVLTEREGGVKEIWREGDEVVVSDADHETNRGAWTRLAQRLGLKVKFWKVTRTSEEGGNRFAVNLDPKALEEVVGERTRLVAFTACSNVLGAFTDIEGAVQVVRGVVPGAMVVVDCVAYAPHRRIEPRKWDVDVAFFSLYKTYGAHVGAAYVAPRIKQKLQRLNHFFLQPPNADIAGMYPFQTSSVQYELNHSIAAVADYLVSLGQNPFGKDVKIDWNNVYSRPTQPSTLDTLVTLSKDQISDALDVAFRKISAHESTLLSLFIPFLLEYYDRGVRIVGPESSSSSIRAPTIAFTIVSTDDSHRVGTSKQIHTNLVHTATIGAQQGHMYAHKLVQSLGLDLHDGVVRLSFVHYNTTDEIQRSIALLKSVFDQIL